MRMILVQGYPLFYPSRLLLLLFIRSCLVWHTSLTSVILWKLVLSSWLELHSLSVTWVDYLSLVTSWQLISVCIERSLRSVSIYMHLRKWTQQFEFRSRMLFFINALGKGINPSILNLSCRYIAIGWLTDFFNFGTTTSLGEEKLWLQTK